MKQGFPAKLAVVGALISSKATTSWRRALSGLLLSGALIGASACNEDGGLIPFPTPVVIQPNGPKPEWGPSIKPEMQAVIEQLDSLTKGVPLYTLTPQQARKAPSFKEALLAVMSKYNIAMPNQSVDTTGRAIPVAGGTIRVRIYTPRLVSPNMPGIVYYHGGGWVIATNDTYDFSARALAAKTGSVVVAVEYRKGPEFRFPTAHNDAFAAYRWVRDNASSMKIDASRIAVAGESAGGNLAATVCIMARDAGIPLPKHQLLVYPIARYDMNTPSYQQFANAKPLSKPAMQWFFSYYLNSPADGASPLISLVNNQNLQGLPPATVINAEIDPLQSEGQQYAAQLKAAGVSVTSKVYVGVTHEFFGMAPVVPQASDAQTLAATELIKSLNL
jgi:acetyl esterase